MKNVRLHIKDVIPLVQLPPVLQFHLGLLSVPVILVFRVDLEGLLDLHAQVGLEALSHQSHPRNKVKEIMSSFKKTTNIEHCIRNLTIFVSKNSSNLPKLTEC